MLIAEATHFLEPLQISVYHKKEKNKKMRSVANLLQYQFNKIGDVYVLS